MVADGEVLDHRGQSAAKWPRPCKLVGMTKALDPKGQCVDLADDEVRHRWHRHPGALKCLVCLWNVHVHRRPRRFYIQHDPIGSVTGETSNTDHAGETYQHEVLKHWVRDRLELLGMDTVVEHGMDASRRRPDVYARKRNRVIAVEVQWSHLDFDLARARTADLRADGCDVVWLVRHCNWIDRLPAVGIVDFDPPDRQYRCLTGLLKIQDKALIPVSDHPLLADFLGHWAPEEAGAAWGYYRQAKGAWATVTDWETHSQTQNERIDELTRDRQTAKQEAADKSSELAAAKAELRTYENRLCHDRNTIAVLMSERDSARNQRDDARKWCGYRPSSRQSFSSLYWRLYSADRSGLDAALRGTAWSSRSLTHSPVRAAPFMFSTAWSACNCRY